MLPSPKVYLNEVAPLVLLKKSTVKGAQPLSWLLFTNNCGLMLFGETLINACDSLVPQSPVTNIFTI